MTADEAGLVGVLLDFANDPPPDDPAAVEAHFRQHPWCGVPFWQSITPAVVGEADPSGERTRDAALAFQSDHAQVRATLHRIAAADGPGRIRIREDVQSRLQSLVVTGRLDVRYRRGALALMFEPGLIGVGVAITYALALVLDTNRPFAAALLECPAPRAAEDRTPCGRFFLRKKRREVYCSPPCVKLGTRERNRQRQWQRRHPEERK